YWLHIFLWTAMLVYFIFAPEWAVFAFAKAGKPLKSDGAIPAETKRITFVVEELEPYSKDGKSLYKLYGWSFIAPEEDQAADFDVRQIVLASSEKVYFFSAESGYRNPDTQRLVADAPVDFNTLGFSTLIAEDAIKPGKYRIGIVFKNSSTGSAYYWDKPAHYLIKTPNTLTFK
ncbi:MAG TPA: hypothetical protein VK141_11500, partial [Nitrosomonas sp.]|nr:hypothetical protein [Nitrosomonas sp.]